MRKFQWSSKNSAVFKDVEDPQADIYQPRYDSYQSVLSNLMTIGTLLLGFIITGTMLSLSLSGEESYTSHDLLLFTEWAFVAVIGAGSTTLIAFLVSVRATQAHCNRGSKHGLKVMRNHTLLIGLSELCLYGSLFAFLLSLDLFLAMQYLGPDICPYVENEHSEERTSSFCALAGSDFFDAVGQTCQAPKVKNDPYYDLCSEFEWTKTKKWQSWFLWDVHVDEKDLTEFSAARLKRIDQAANLQCMKDMMNSNMKVLCTSPATTLERQACADSYMAFTKADACVGEKIADAERCYKICGWFGGKHPKALLTRMVHYFMYPIYALLVVIALYRIYKNLMQMRAWMKTLRAINRVDVD